jgi:hypothetical protein
MLKFYYSGAPNPTKVALFLEETSTPYDPIPIDTRKGEQHKPEFLAINPNAKLPAPSTCVRLMNRFFLKDRCALPDQMSFLPASSWRTLVLAKRERHRANKN